MDVLGPYPTGPFNAFDVLISDVQPEDLPGKISKALGTDYLADIGTIPNPVTGIVFKTKDDKLRVLFTLPVSARGRSVATHFIFDTGAPRTYIALSVLDALDLPEVSMPSEVLKVNGVKANLGVSDTSKVSYGEGAGKVEEPCHFVGLNLLGMDFLDRASVKLEIDLATNSARMTSNQFQMS